MKNGTNNAAYSFKTSFGRIFCSAKNSGFAGLRAHALRPRRGATIGGHALWLLRTPPEANPQDLRPLAQTRCPPGGHGFNPSTPRGEQNPSPFHLIHSMIDT
jgi:hypothetical protein